MESKILNEILEINDSYQAPEKIMKVLLNKKEREELFMKLLRANDMNVDFDWFYEAFQDDHADRKNMKQDFTPRCVGDLLSKLVSNSSGDNGNYYEPCAGTGGIMITHWNNFRRSYSPFVYTPDLHFAHVEELSDRAIPFLLLNMMIRGMNGVVIHCDVLTRKAKNAYYIHNNTNNHMGFSSITIVPHTEQFERELSVKWESKEYIEHDETIDTVELLENIAASKNWTPPKIKVRG